MNKPTLGDIFKQAVAPDGPASRDLDVIRQRLADAKQAGDAQAIGYYTESLRQAETAHANLSKMVGRMG